MPPCSARRACRCYGRTSKDLALRPGRPAPPRAAMREARAPLPQGSLAPDRVLLSRPIRAYYDPIRRSRRHTGISRPSRLYPAPSLCGSASATRETFPSFPPALSLRAVDPTPVGPRPPPVVLAPRHQASPCYDRVATHKARLCQQCPTGYVFSALHRSNAVVRVGRHQRGGEQRNGRQERDGARRLRVSALQRARGRTR